MKINHRLLSIALLLVQVGLLAVLWIVVQDLAAKPSSVNAQQTAPTPEAVRVDIPPFDYNLRSNGVSRQSFLHTSLLDPSPFQVKTYTIQKGDTAWSIANEFNLKIESILWGNEGMSADAGLLRIGQKIYILPVDGVLHTVKEGDTVEKLASRHRVNIQDIVQFIGNRLPLDPPYPLEVGQQIVVPNGVNPVAWEEPGPPVEAGKGRKSSGYFAGPLVTVGTGTFIWPITPIYITQIYWTGHRAIDIGAYVGQPVFASDSGTVIFSGWDKTGFGNLVIIDHGNGYWTYYGHNSVLLVRQGQGVLQGQQVAEAGSTGRSTGPHVDFRIRIDASAFLNPADFLP